MDVENPSVFAHAESYSTWWRDAGFEVPCGEKPAGWLNAADADATDFDAYVRALEAAPLAPSARDAVAEPTPPRQANVADWPQLPSGLNDLSRYFIELSAKTNRPCLSAEGTGGESLCIITDRPTLLDEKAGRFFTGEDGQLFGNMMKAIGLSRADIFLTAAIPYAGRGETHSPDAQAYLAALLRRQISLISARHILVFGDAGSRFLLGETAVKMRGRLHEINHDKGQSSLSTTFHPHGLLTRPEFKKLAWQDLQLVAKALGTL